MVRVTLSGLMAFVSLLIAGCATTATGTTTSVIQTPALSVPLEATAPPGSSLVVVRYPATVEADARDAFHTAYLRSTIGGAVNADTLNNPDAYSIADSTIVKSNYFALSLYRELASRLPDHSVLLSPHAIDVDENGALTSTPMTSAERIASVLTVDFATYSFPDAEKMMSGEPLTFGDLITPLVVVQADHRAMAPTNGLLLASNSIVRGASGNAKSEVRRSLQAIQSGSFESSPPELHFVSHLKGTTDSNLSTQRLRIDGTSNAIQTYPLEKIMLDRDVIATLNHEGNETSDPLGSVFSKGLSDRIIAMLNSIDTEKASMIQRAAAVSNYDSNLAALSLVGNSSADYATRLKYAERLLDAERKYLSIQSLRIFDGVQNGEMGAQIRDMIVAENEILKEHRKLARQQNLATAGAVVGAAVVLGGGVGGGDTAGVILDQLIFNAALLAAQQAVVANQQMAGLADGFWASIAPAIDEQLEVQVDLLGSNETITAIRFEDLRAKLQTLYAENQRSIDTIATSCGYAHEGSELKGKWHGVCENGRAAGPGVGVLINEDGSDFEYYGEALNGRPHGRGYMIEHSENGSKSIEGSFSNGQPDGVVRVSVAGSADKYRRYQNGVDAGPAAASDLASQLFTANSPGIQ